MIIRDIRYQAAIVEGQHVLLAQMGMPDGRTFWVPPEGGKEGQESPAWLARLTDLFKPN